MAWLRGSSDWNNLRQDLYNLITGAAAAGQRGSGQSGNGATAASGDWVGLDPTNFIVRSSDTLVPFYCPIELWRGIPRFIIHSAAASSTTIVQEGKPTFTGIYNGMGGNARAYFIAYLSVINTTAGDLLGAQVTWQLFNADTGATIKTATATNLTSGSVSTITLTGGISLTITVNPEQRFSGTSIAYWARGYSTTYPQGVDYHPDLAKVDTSQAITISSTATGTNLYSLDTDYKIVSQGDTYPTSSGGGMIGGAVTNYHYADRGQYGVFSGIEWQAVAAPPTTGSTYYVVSCNCFQAYMYISAAGIQSTCITLEPMEFWDPIRQKGRAMCITTGATNAPINSQSRYSTPMVALFTGSPLSTYYVNYWISVKADKIVLIMRGDPANGGLMSMFTFQKTTAINSAVDKNTWMMFNTGSNVGSYNSYFGAALVSERWVYETPYWGPTTFGPLVSVAPNYHVGIWGYGAIDQGGGGANLTSMQSFTATNPMSTDKKWWLYTLYTSSPRGGYDASLNFTTLTRSTGWRSLLRGIYGMGVDNWSSLDELVDGSNTYLLVTVWQALGGAYSNLAVLEE